ncbi:MAG: tetratricopeptide repeat protein [Rubripirellula sp.]
MIQQWQRSMSTGSDSINLIYRLSSIRLSEDQIVNELMPNRWSVPYQLAQELKDQDSAAGLRTKLLQKSSEIADATLSNETSRHRTKGMIAAAYQDFETASEHYEKAIKSDPKDPQLRHLAATSLYQIGNAKQAVRHARVATLLDPKNSQFREFYRKATQLHRSQYSIPVKDVE